jgi:fructose-1,6-bisphosphatase I
MIVAHTLSRFIRGQERKHWGATGELSDLLTSIALGVKIISSLVATSGFKGLTGYTGNTNVQGEETSALDEAADSILVDVLGTSGHFGSLVSEERDHLVETPHGSQNGKYVVAFDPLDGSSNIALNIPIGTIFTVFRKKEMHRPAQLDDYLQPGNKIVAAGYAVYGAKTTFVYSTGDGVHSFTYDPAIGEFMLTHERIQCPARGSIYATNEGYSERWQPEVVSYIQSLKQKDSARGTPYSARYVGSLVSDFDRILHKGGVYLYPADTKQPSGKLRLLYECMPLAYIVAQAGGRAVDGARDILDIVPDSIHQRSPFIIGSRDDITQYQQALKLP